MTHVSPLVMGAFTCNSHVTNVTLKTIEILWCKTKLFIFLLISMLFATNACGFIETGIMICWTITSEINVTYVTKSQKRHI